MEPNVPLQPYLEEILFSFGVKGSNPDKDGTNIEFLDTVENGQENTYTKHCNHLFWG